MQEEVDQKTIALAVKTGKLTAQVLQAAIRKYLAARQKGTGKAHHGQQSLRQLKKDGSALSNIEITDANIGLFKPCAKKYDIDFTLRKDRTTHPPASYGKTGQLLRVSGAAVPFRTVRSTAMLARSATGEVNTVIYLYPAC